MQIRGGILPGDLLEKLFSADTFIRFDCLPLEKAIHSNGDALGTNDERELKPRNGNQSS